MVMIDFNLVGDHGRMWSLFSFTCFHISMSSSLLERSSNKSLTSGPQRVFPFFLTAQKRLRRCSMAAWERTLPLHIRRPFSSMVTSSSSSVLQSVLKNKISLERGPQSEWGPGRAARAKRASIWRHFWRPRTPFTPRTSFKGKCVYNLSYGGLNKMRCPLFPLK